MNSAFSSPRPNAPTSNTNTDENYNLGGLNMVDPDAIMPEGDTPFTINSRHLANDEDDSQVAIRTRKGASHLSDPVGEVLNVQNVATVTGDVTFNTSTVVAQPFTPSSGGALTKMLFNIKKDSGTSGDIIIEIYSNNAGAPQTLLAQSSIDASVVNTTYSDLTSYYIDAPTLVSGTQYWAVLYTQDNGTGNYYVSKTAASGAITATFTDGVVSSYTALGYSFRFKSYLSTPGEVKGWHLRYPSSSVNNCILFAQKDSIYSTTKGTGTISTVYTGGSNSSTKVRFAQFNDYTAWVDGLNPPKWWDGTTVTSIPNAPTSTPQNVIIWQNRMFLQTTNTRVDFCNLNDATTWDSTNFFYVPSPGSPDSMTGWKVFKDNLVIFTHETKHIILGGDITSFTRKEAEATKGAVSQEAIVADRNYIYFMADDGQIYRFNGSSDQLLSRKVAPELKSITDKSKVRLDLYDNQLRVYYQKSPATYNESMLVLYLEENKWFKDTEHSMQGSTNLYLDNNELIEFSSLVGQVSYGETQNSDLGKMIDWKYWTNYKTYAFRSRTRGSYGGASAKKRIKRFRPVVRTVDADYTLRVGKDMDFANNPDMREYIVTGGGAKWGHFTWNDGTLWGSAAPQIDNPSGMSGRGKHIQYRFERKGVNTPVELYGYIAAYVIGRQK